MRKVLNTRSRFDQKSDFSSKIKSGHRLAAAGRSGHLLRKVLGAYGVLEGPILRSDGSHGVRSAFLERFGCSYSVSYTGREAVIAIAGGGAVGIDIETVGGLPSKQPVMDHFFSPAERCELDNRTAVERETLFYSFWTAKEALAKATGDGLAADFSQMTCRKHLGGISLGRGKPPYTPARWSLRSFEILDAIVGTIAQDRPIHAVHYWSMPLSEGKVLDTGTR
ncbi:MAG: 4'-phosphopantetheinyl transferase superfamily protein [Pseudomonadota bacterium]